MVSPPSPGSWGFPVAWQEEPHGAYRVITRGSQGQGRAVAQRTPRPGIEEGARLVSGPDGLEKGNYVTPTVFADVDNGMRIAQEEIFGPVLVVIAYDDEDDAVRIANDSEYGLWRRVERGPRARDGGRPPAREYGSRPDRLRRAQDGHPQAVTSHRPGPGDDPRRASGHRSAVVGGENTGVGRGQGVTGARRHRDAYAGARRGSR